MLPTKIVVIGAGSASFGLNTLSALLRSASLRGSRLALVDHNPETLKLVGRLANRLNQDWEAQLEITTHTNHVEALEGAEFVILSIEVSPREALWRSDFEIPLKYGVRQPYAENGGPGGFAHAARNIGPILKIAHDMEQVCPGAWLINFTNPMVRICDAISRYSRIKVAGLCHQTFVGYAMVGKTLAKELDIQVPAEFIHCHSSPEVNDKRHQVAMETVKKVDILAAGLNHFTWMVDVHDRRTGEDLYPLFARHWAAMDPSFEPLTRRVYSAFGLFPIPGDEHLCEYIPWTNDPITRPWEKYDISLYDWNTWDSLRNQGYIEMAAMADRKASIDSLRETDSEGALEIIENLAGAGNHYHLAVNLPNRGQIENLPRGAIVETPVIFSGAGIHPVNVGPIPEPVAELCRREIAVVRLSVDAAVHGDRQAALQCLLLDPVVTDLDIAQCILDDYLETYRQHLPQFWS